MPTPALITSDRYTSLDNTRVYWLPSIAAVNLTPTRTEMNNGIDLTDEINDWAGWTLARADLATPDLGHLFEGSIPGKMTSEQSSLTFYASKDGHDIRDTLSIDTEGFIMFCDGGDIGGNSADVYPVKVKSLPKQRSVNGEAADKIMAQFSITRQPAENVTIPA